MCPETKPLHCRTPVIESQTMSDRAGRKVFLKLENLQPTASFKIRGQGKLCQEAKRNGYKLVVTSSGGNAGLAVAYAARKLGMEARIVVPVTTPLPVVHKLQVLGATVEISGSVWNESDVRAKQIVAQEGGCYCHPFDDPLVWSAQASLVHELKEQLEEKPGLVITCVGGGGLLCGILQGINECGWDDVPVLAMETDGANSFNATVKAGKLVTLQKITSIAITLGSTVVCSKLLDYLKTNSIYSETVPDRDAVSACCNFADEHRMLVEPSCGAALSGIYSGIVKKLDKENKLPPGPIVVVVCGGSAATLSMLQKWKDVVGLI